MNWTMILLVLLAIAMLPMWLLGTYVFTKVILLPNPPPADRTNRINHLRLVFWAIQSPQQFVSLFPWLKRDEAENLK